MPIPASILHPALINAADNPALLDILVELSQDIDTIPQGELPSNDPEYIAASRRITQRMKDHFGWHDESDLNDLEEAINAVSSSSFTGINQQIPAPAKHLEESRQPRFSTTQFLLPDDLSKAILDLSNRIPDDVLTHSGRESTPHITVKYGLHEMDPEVIRQAVENYGPVNVKLGKTSVFPADETQGGYDVVKVDVDSDDLHGLNRVICDAIPHTDMHKDYQPHVTLGYVQPGAGEHYSGWNALDGKEVLLNELVFSDANKQATRIPLGESKGTKDPTTHVDDVLATLEAIRDGVIEVSSEELQALLDGLNEEELVKVEAMFGGEVEVMEGKQLIEAWKQGEQVGSLKASKKPLYKWYDSETGQTRVQSVQPGTGRQKKQQNDQPSSDNASSPDVSQQPKKEKQPKPSTSDAHAAIKSVLDSDNLTDEHVSQIATALKSLTVKDITALKQQLGLKASGKKEELIQKIAQRAVEGVRKAREQGTKLEPQGTKQEQPRDEAPDARDEATPVETPKQENPEPVEQTPKQDVPVERQEEKVVEPEPEPSQQSKELDVMSPTDAMANSLQRIRDTGGTQDDFLALGLSKLPVKDVAKVAEKLGVTSKDASKTGLIRAIQRHALEGPKQPEARGEVPAVRDEVQDPRDEAQQEDTAKSELEKPQNESQSASEETQSRLQGIADNIQSIFNKVYTAGYSKEDYNQGKSLSSVIDHQRGMARKEFDSLNLHQLPSNEVRDLAKAFNVDTTRYRSKSAQINQIFRGFEESHEMFGSGTSGDGALSQFERGHDKVNVTEPHEAPTIKLSGARKKAQSINVEKSQKVKKQEKKPVDTPFKPREVESQRDVSMDALKPVINKIDTLTRYAKMGFSREKLQDDLQRLQLPKHSNAELKHIAKAIGVDLNMYGKNKQSLIDGIRRVPLEIHEMYVHSAG